MEQKFDFIPTSKYDYSNLNPMSMKKIIQSIILLSFFVGFVQFSNAQSCASGNSFDLDENDFPQTCITSNGADGTATSATFSHDFATNTAGVYSSGTDGTDDVTVTMNVACSFPNGTNGTTVAGACLGSNGINTSQSNPQLVTNQSGGSDFGGATVNDHPCANCWVIVEYDFINGFTSTADGFDIDWSSMNGGTEGLEVWGGWVEGTTFTAPTVNTANLSTFCHAQAVAGETMMTWLTGVGAGAALPAGVFGADAITGGPTGPNAPTECPTEEPPSTSGPNSTVSTGMGDGAIPANWGLTATDVIDKVTFIYMMSNSNADDCDGDTFTEVNTSPSGSLSTVDFCVPEPPCNYTFDVATTEDCGEFTIDISNITGIGSADPVTTEAYDIVINGTTVSTASTGTSQTVSMIGGSALTADGSTSYSVVIQLNSDATCASDPVVITAPVGNSPNCGTFPANPAGM